MIFSMNFARISLRCSVAPCFKCFFQIQSQEIEKDMGLGNDANIGQKP